MEKEIMEKPSEKERVHNSEAAGIVEVRTSAEIARRGGRVKAGKEMEQ